LDVAIHDVVDCLNFIWMMQFKMLWILLFGVDLNYIFNFCTTSSFVKLDLDLCFIFIFSVQTFTYSIFFTLRYIGILFFFSLSRNLLLESVVGIRIWFWMRFWNFYFKWVKSRQEKNNEKNKETKSEVNKWNKRNKKIPSKFWKAKYKLYWTFQYPQGTIDKNYKIRVGKRLKNTKKKIDWFYMVIENWLVLVFHVLFGGIPLTPMCKTNIQPLFCFCYMC
jgi:hypothetical protein